jgi:hypothetical protein
MRLSSGAGTYNVLAAGRRCLQPYGMSPARLWRQVVGGVQLNPRPEQLELLRRPLPQAPAVHKLLADPNGSGATAEYVRINYFSSDATKAVMRVCSPHCPLSMCSHVLQVVFNPWHQINSAVC